MSGLRAEVIGCGKQTKTPVLHVQLLGRAAAGISREQRREEEGRAGEDPREACAPATLFISVNSSKINSPLRNSRCGESEDGAHISDEGSLCLEKPPLQMFQHACLLLSCRDFSVTSASGWKRRLLRDFKLQRYESHRKCQAGRNCDDTGESNLFLPLAALLLTHSLLNYLSLYKF